MTQSKYDDIIRDPKLPSTRFLDYPFPPKNGSPKFSPFLNRSSAFLLLCREKITKLSWINENFLYSGRNFLVKWCDYLLNPG